MYRNMKTDNFNVTWKDFENCTSNSLRGFIERQEFVDVTLACDDANQIQAHKVILSACSDFFKNILLKHRNQPHPFVYLDNVSFEDLKNVISFMYFGESSVSQDGFSTFLKAAEKLKIKGLSEQYCKEIPSPEPAQAKRKRGPRKARYKAMIKTELFESAKYVNVVDAISKTIEDENVENALFFDVEMRKKEANVGEDIQCLEFKEAEEEGLDDEDATTEETCQALEVVETADNDESEDDGSDNDSSDEYLPNENEQFSDTDSDDESDDDPNMEERIVIEDVMEHINENGDDWMITEDVSGEQEIKQEMEVTKEFAEEEDDTSSNDTPAKKINRRKFHKYSKRKT